MTSLPMPAVLHGDLTAPLAAALRQAPAVAVDTETTGLRHDRDRLVMVQLLAPGLPPVLVRLDRRRPKRLAALVEDPTVQKVFHHAMFDLRFMAAAWQLRPAAVACTKVCAKILQPEAKAHSLVGLVQAHLGVTLDKSAQRSDWTADTLSAAQIRYAVRDVQFLLPLKTRLREALEAEGRWALAEQCCRFLPTQVAVEMLGVEGVFRY